MNIEEQIERYVEFIVCDFSEEGKKQLCESYKAIATQAAEEERERILDMVEKIIKVWKYEKGYCSCCGFMECVGDESHYCEDFNSALFQVKSLINKSN